MTLPYTNWFEERDGLFSVCTLCGALFDKERGESRRMMRRRKRRKRRLMCECIYIEYILGVVES